MLWPRKFASCAEKKHGHGYDPMKKYGYDPVKKYGYDPMKKYDYDPMKKYGYDPIKCHVQQSPLEPWKTFSDCYKRSMVEHF